MSVPFVSVIMPAYNAERYVELAVDSILSQTLTDFEFIIVDDGSTDDTWKLLASYSDPRVRLIRSEHGGVAKAFNTAISLVRGKYVARMDADDVCSPERLHIQTKYLERNPEVSVVGSNVSLIGNTGGVKKIRFPSRSEDIKVSMFLHEKNLCNPAVMIRSSVLSAYGCGEVEFSEDLEMWIRMSGKEKFHNLPNFLLSYRVHDTQISSKTKIEQSLAALNMTVSFIEREFGGLTTDQKLCHFALVSGESRGLHVSDIISWGQRFRDINRKVDFFDDRSLYTFLSFKILKWSLANETSGALRNLYFLGRYLLTFPGWRQSLGAIRRTFYAIIV